MLLKVFSLKFVLVIEHRGGIDIAFGSLADLGWESSAFCMVGEIFISTGSDSTGSNISTRPV